MYVVLCMSKKYEDIYIPLPYVAQSDLSRGSNNQMDRWPILWRRNWQPTLVFLPGRLQSMGSQKARHDWAASLSLLWASLIIFPWGTPVFTGFSWQGQRCVLSNTGFHSRKPPLSTWSATANIEFLVEHHTPLWSVSYLMATWLHWVSFTQDRAALYSYRNIQSLDMNLPSPCIILLTKLSSVDLLNALILHIKLLLISEQTSKQIKYSSCPMLMELIDFAMLRTILKYHPCLISWWNHLLKPEW